MKMSLLNVWSKKRFFMVVGLIVGLVIAVMLFAFFNVNNNYKKFPLYGMDEASVSDVTARYGEPNGYIENDGLNYQMIYYNDISFLGSVGRLNVFYRDSEIVLKANWSLEKDAFNSLRDYEQACKEITEILSNICKDWICTETSAGRIWKNPYTQQSFSVVSTMNATTWYYDYIK